MELKIEYLGQKKKEYMSFGLHAQKNMVGR